MKTTKKETYCRACGADKGHDFRHCSNFKAMRDIIESQDIEVQTLRKQLTESKEKCSELVRCEDAIITNLRIQRALLDLIERDRVPTSTKVIVKEI